MDVSFASIWEDQFERQRMFEGLFADDTDEREVEAAITLIDGAVVRGLELLGLPRGEVGSIQLVPGGRGWIGRKTQACDILIARLEGGVAVFRDREPLRVLRTWVHESIHARKPFSAEYRSEYIPFRGYEEGMVEVLTRSAMTSMTGDQSHLASPLEYFVEGYTALARVLKVSPEVIARALWQWPAGGVRLHFEYEISRIAGGSGRRVSDSDRLRGVADRIFSSDRMGYTADPSILARLWEATIT